MKILLGLKRDGNVIWGYGASAKGNTLINYFGITNKIIDIIIILLILTTYKVEYYA